MKKDRQRSCLSLLCEDLKGKRLSALSDLVMSEEELYGKSVKALRTDFYTSNLSCICNWIYRTVYRRLISFIL